MNRSLTTRAIVVTVIVILSLIGLWPTIQASRITDDMRVEAETNPALAAKIASWESRAIRKGLDLEGDRKSVV